MKRHIFKNIDHYISAFPEDIAIKLTQLRNCIQKTAIKAEEAICYNMPAFQQDNKVFVYFAAFKNHICF